MASVRFSVIPEMEERGSLQQIRNLFMDFDIPPKYLIRDRDLKYGKLLEGKNNSLGIDEIVTAYQSPPGRMDIANVLSKVLKGNALIT